MIREKNNTYIYVKYFSVCCRKGKVSHNYFFLNRIRSIICSPKEPQNTTTKGLQAIRKAMKLKLWPIPKIIKPLKKKLSINELFLFLNKSLNLCSVNFFFMRWLYPNSFKVQKRYYRKEIIQSYLSHNQTSNYLNPW